MSRVTLTIKLDLDMPGLPSSEALNAAFHRAERAAARVFLEGDAGGKMRVEVEPGAHGVPATCEALDTLAGSMAATIGRRRRDPVEKEGRKPSKKRGA